MKPRLVTRWTLPFVVMAMMLAGSASAVSSRSSAMGRMQARETMQVRALAHAEGVVRWWDRRESRIREELSVHGLGWLPEPSVVRWHRSQMVWLRSELGQTRSTIHDLRIMELRPAHYDGWRCIAGYPGARPAPGGESGGDPNASNGSHFNILQMTNPWAGINPIGMSPAAIMQAAESQLQAAIARGTERSWLEGQWGQTIGPCWQFFSG